MITHCSEQLLRSLASEDTTTKEASSQLRRDAPKYPWTTMLFTVALVVAITTTLGAEANSVAPVVRPTVFVNTAAASSGQQISNASNQNNAVATSSAAPLIQQQPAAANEPLQAMQSMQPTTQTMQTAATTTSTRITPMKSRLCQTQNSFGAPTKTDRALGMQSYAIDDLSLSASSSSNEQVGPQFARLNVDAQGGAWCPAKPISMPTLGREWIQAKLNRSFVITAIETQGRATGKEFAPSYQIEYSRDSGRTWHRWRDFRGANTLRANEDVNSVVRNELSPPIIGANVIRLLPYSAHLRTVCMRFELFGCQYDEGAPVAYATAEGVNEPRWGHLMDYTYDGWRRNGLLSSGLGQLVDGVKGADNFSHNAGFEWVGWKSMNGDVVIEFTFKTLRNFTGALFHSNNLFSSGVEVFQGVDVHFGIDSELAMDPLRDALNEQQRRRRLAAGTSGGSISRRSSEQATQADYFAANNNNSNNSIDGLASELQAAAHAQTQQHNRAPATMWSADVLSIEYEPDKRLETSRPVTVHLKQRLANKLRFVLKFASKWILVSEVEFLSHPIELLSLSSLDPTKSPPLMAALTTSARSYDEFVAILREHQLRRIAASSFMEHTSSVAADDGLGVVGSTQQLNDADDTASTSSSVSTMDDELDSSDNSNSDQTAGSTQQAAGDNNSAQQASSFPASNPALSQPAAANNFMQPFYPSNLPVPPAASSQPNLMQQPSDSPILNANNNNNNQMFGGQPSQRDLNLNSSASTGSVGISTVISLLMAAALIVAAISFVGARVWTLCIAADNSKRAHLQHRLHSPLVVGASTGSADSRSTMHHVHHHHQHTASHLPRHLCDSSGGGSLSASDSNKSTAGDINSAQSHDIAALMIDGQYKSLFAAANATQHNSNGCGGGGGGVRSTLKRLAALTSGGGGSDSKHSPALFNAQQQQQQQLLVSLKDTNRPPKTQLIVGLNQANPLAQQQIYNNCASSNQTYTSHCSSSVSSASQLRPSTTYLHSANQPSNQSHLINDVTYDYATPDVNYGPAFVQRRSPQPSALVDGYRTTDLRSSHRMLQAQLLHHSQQQQPLHSTLHLGQQQVGVQRSRPLMPASEHNYELIHSNESQSSQQRSYLTNSNAPATTTQTNQSMTLNGHLRASNLAPEVTQRARQMHQNSNASNSNNNNQHCDPLDSLGRAQSSTPSQHYYTSATTTTTTDCG